MTHLGRHHYWDTHQIVASHRKQKGKLDLPIIFLLSSSLCSLESGNRFNSTNERSHNSDEISLFIITTSYQNLLKDLSNLLGEKISEEAGENSNWVGSLRCPIDLNETGLFKVRELGN